MLKVTLRRNDAPSYRTATIEFPASENELVKTLEVIGVGITTEKNCLVEQIGGDGSSLQSLVGQSIITALKAEYSITELCNYLGMNRDCYYYEPKQSKKEMELTQKVVETFKRNRGVYGQKSCTMP